jgi:hypothetical protein
MATSFVTASFPLPALLPFTAQRAQDCVRGPLGEWLQRRSLKRTYDQFSPPRTSDCRAVIRDHAHHLLSLGKWGRRAAARMRSSIRSGRIASRGSIAAWRPTV